MPVWLVNIIVGISLQILGYMLMPKPKQPSPPQLEDYNNPTFESGREIPKVFGTVTIRGLNGIYWGDKAQRSRKVRPDD